MRLGCRSLLGQEMKQEPNQNPERSDQQECEHQALGKAQTNGRIRRVPGYVRRSIRSIELFKPG
jgi:hypothetical protein